MVVSHQAVGTICSWHIDYIIFPAIRVNKTVYPPPTLLMAQKLGWLTYWDGPMGSIQNRVNIQLRAVHHDLGESNLCSFGVPLRKNRHVFLYMTKNPLVDPGYIFIIFMLPKPSTGATKVIFFSTPWTTGLRKSGGCRSCVLILGICWIYPPSQ